MKRLKLWKLPSCQLMHFRRWCFFSPGGICQFTGGYHDFCSFPCCFHCLLPKLVQLFMLQVTNSELLVTPKSKGWYPKSRWTYHLRPQEFLSPFFGGLTLKQTEGDLQTAHVIFHAKNGRTGNPRRVSLAVFPSRSLKCLNLFRSVWIRSEWQENLGHVLNPTSLVIRM